MSASPARRPPWSAALVNTGLVAGFADGSAAVLTHLARGGRTPIRIFNFIASALVGPDAMRGGLPLAALGFALHMGIALTWVTLFWVAAWRWPALLDRLVPVSIGYGAVIWLVMNLVVLPLSRVQTGRFSPSTVAVGAGVLMLCVALPAALGARRYWRAA
jgi:hypothetical protein